MEHPPNLTLPGNPRYQPKSLQPYFGYDNLFRGAAEVEIATMRTLAEIGIMSSADAALLTPDVEEKLRAIRTTEVDRVEKEVTKHDVRAWVRLAQQVTGPTLGRWVHWPLTSYDAVDTGRVWTFMRAHDNVVRPSVRTVMESFARMATKYADAAQIGRTHGQFAVPITVGFWIATVLHRVAWAYENLEHARDALRGKLSGPVGAYNAHTALDVRHRCAGLGTTFERMVLEKIGLEPAAISTQIAPPEPIANYLHACVLLSAAFAQFGRDCRHLMRSEIEEICEEFGATQVGSSTMAQKRNPVNFENVEGTEIKAVAEYQKVMMVLVSEHQRDLVGSCVARDFPTIVVDLTCQLDVLNRKNETGRTFIDRIGVDTDACLRNLRAAGESVLAEPWYLALQMTGYEGDAHELINRKAIPLVKGGMPFREAIVALTEEDPALREAYKRIPSDTLTDIRDPQEYVGLAKEKAWEIVGDVLERHGLDPARSS